MATLHGSEVWKAIKCSEVVHSEVFFKIILFLDTLTQKNNFFDHKINNFWGDQSGISAKTATLVVQYVHLGL